MSAVPLDRQKLARVLGMLGSNHDGEILAAARQAERLRTEAGLTWPDIVVPRLPSPPHGQNVRTAADAARFVLQHDELLTDWERDFVHSIRHQHRLSPKQLAILDRLVEKVRRTAARAA